MAEKTPENEDKKTASIALAQLMAQVELLPADRKENSTWEKSNAKTDPRSVY